MSATREALVLVGVVADAAGLKPECAPELLARHTVWIFVGCERPKARFELVVVALPHREHLRGLEVAFTAEHDLGDWARDRGQRGASVIVMLAGSSVLVGRLTGCTAWYLAHAVSW